MKVASGVTGAVKGVWLSRWKQKNAGVRDARDLETLGRNGGVSRQNGLFEKLEEGFSLPAGFVNGKLRARKA